MSDHIIRLIPALLLVLLCGCRHDDIIYIPENVPVSTPEYSGIDGFYLLNEGNMGSNKCTLDWFDAESGVYSRNIYGLANPDVPMELGDVGNDLRIYGSRLYAVVNCSNKIEVMDAASCRRISQVDIPNCRKIRFHERYAYVTSYAGPVEISEDYRQIGYVAKIDTATLQVVDRCNVGYQPDGIEIIGDRIYVANSGGYIVPNYENTVSVIDIRSFTEIERITVAENLNLLLGDRSGRLWIASRGDYIKAEPRLYCYDTRKRRLVADLPVAASSMTLHGDSIYCVASVWNEPTMSKTAAYAIVDTRTQSVAATDFGADVTSVPLKVPYLVEINPVNGDLYLGDARTYVNPGRLYCFGSDRKLKWEVRTGDIPAHIAFRGRIRKQ